MFQHDANILVPLMASKLGFTECSVGTQMCITQFDDICVPENWVFNDHQQNWASMMHLKLCVCADQNSQRKALKKSSQQDENNQITKIWIWHCRRAWDDCFSRHSKWNSLNFMLENKKSAGLTKWCCGVKQANFEFRFFVVDFNSYS